MRKIIAAAALVALAGCVSAPPGVNADAWWSARRHCQAQASSDSMVAASLTDHLSAFTALTPAGLPSGNPRSLAWQEEHYAACMSLRGYLPGPYKDFAYAPW